MNSRFEASGRTLFARARRAPVIAAAAAIGLLPRLALAACAGDCDEDSAVSVAELVTAVNMALGQMPMEACENADANGDHAVSVDELVKAVNAAVSGPFSGTFEAVEELIFQRYGCTERACHGSSASGGLDLSPGVAYHNLVEVP